MSKSRDLANIISGGFTADDIPSLDASKITTGTFADARLSEGSVTQHVTAFDDNKIVNDLSTLALRQASDNDKAAYSTNSSFVDVFQDATGIDTTTNVTRLDEEFVSSTYSFEEAFTSDSDTVLLHNMENSSDSSNSGLTLTTSQGDASLSTGQAKFGSQSLRTTGNANGIASVSPNSNQLNFGTGALTVETWIYPISGGNYQGVIGRWNNAEGGANVWDMRYKSADAGGNFAVHDGTATRNSGQTLPLNTWSHIAWTRDGSGNNALWYNGNQKTTWSNSASLNIGNVPLYFGMTDSPSTFVFNGYLDEVRLSTVARYSSNFTPNLTTVNNATGNFTGTTITAPSSVSEMGAIITYQDQAGTNALNTDIVLQLSADGGSNYSTATLTAMPDFSTGIKMAKVNDLAVTAGTQLKYKISFANQSSGSKEARIRGVSLQY